MQKKTKLAVCGVFLLAAGEPSAAGGGKDKEPVREIALKSFKLGQAKGKPESPTEIAGAAELAKALPDEKIAAALAKEVDFAKEKLVYFAWAGSGGDKLSFSKLIENNKLVVVFLFDYGATDDLRQHHHLFAFPKDAMWVFSAKK